MMDTATGDSQVEHMDTGGGMNGSEDKTKESSNGLDSKTDSQEKCALNAEENSAEEVSDKDTEKAEKTLETCTDEKTKQEDNDATKTEEEKIGHDTETDKDTEPDTNSKQEDNQQAEQVVEKMELTESTDQTTEKTDDTQETEAKQDTSLNTSAKETASNTSITAESEADGDESKKGVLDRSVIMEGKRKRHSVERMVIGQDTGARKAKPMAPGQGTELGEIPYVRKVLEKTASVDMLGLYRICFGKVGKKSTLKRELREFTGFPFGESDPEFIKRRNIANKFTAAQLKEIVTMLGIERGAKKENMVEGILKFVHKPKDLGKSPDSLSKRKKSTKKRKSQTKKTEKGAAKGPKAKKAKKSKVEAESSDEEEEGDSSGDEEDSDQDEEEDGSANDEKETSPKKDSKKENVRAAGNIKAQPWGVDGPTDKELDNEIDVLLHAMDLSQATMKEMCVEIAKKFPKLNMDKHKADLKQRIKTALDQLDP